MPGLNVDHALEGGWPTELQPPTGAGDLAFGIALEIRNAAQNALLEMDASETRSQAVHSLPAPFGNDGRLHRAVSEADVRA